MDGKDCPGEFDEPLLDDTITTKIKKFCIKDKQPEEPLVFNLEETQYDISTPEFWEDIGEGTGYD